MYEAVTDHCGITIAGRNGCGECENYKLSTSYEEEESVRSVAPEKPPRRNRLTRQRSRHNANEVVAKFSMKSCGNVADSCVTIDQINLENGFSRSKLVDRSAQTSHLIPYRLRFWPRLKSNVKLGPSESSCTKLRLICLCRVVSQWLLSQVGLTLILFIWALVGAYGFLITEGPREQQQSDDIIRIQDEIALELTDQLEKSTHTNWPEVMHKYMDKHKKLLLEAVSAGYGEGGEGRIWTYPGCILFSVSLLTTLGFGAPVPRTPQGRGAAILFAAVGIPLHFLLILNMGNLMAIKLQKLAFKGNPSDLPQPNAPLWLKWFPVVVITLYYFLGVIFFGFVRQRDAIDSFMFPLDFTAVGGVASVAGHVRVLYALYLEVAVTLAAIIVSLIQASTTRGIVDLCLRLGLLTNT